MKNLKTVVIFWSVCFAFSGCTTKTATDQCYCEDHETSVGENSYKTENIIILVIDGLRYSEGAGRETDVLTPYLYGDFAEGGATCSNFFNEGTTRTTSGHGALLSGRYQNLDNTGSEPTYCPTIMQRWGKKTADGRRAFVFSGKRKLRFLDNSNHPLWKNAYKPDLIAGDGLETYPDAVITEIAKTEMENHTPNLVLLSLPGVDIAGHTGVWDNYIARIQEADALVEEVWNFIEDSPFYQNKTTLFVTNDHGRHLDGVEDGFTSHGDDCLGCRKISLVARGPDFKSNFISEEPRELIDITKTVAELLQVDLPNCEGEVMWELFE